MTLAQRQIALQVTHPVRASSAAETRASATSKKAAFDSIGCESTDRPAAAPYREMFLFTDPRGAADNIGGRDPVSTRPNSASKLFPRAGPLVRVLEDAPPCIIPASSRQGTTPLAEIA